MSALLLPTATILIASQLVRSLRTGRYNLTVKVVSKTEWVAGAAARLISLRVERQSEGTNFLKSGYFVMKELMTSFGTVF